jgi:hypothetical protein
LQVEILVLEAVLLVAAPEKRRRRAGALSLPHGQK